jgi:hypothetical protein
MLDKFNDYFNRKGLSARAPQKEVLEQLAQNWDKKYFIVSAPTRSR